ncbi:hypothetical protein HN011_006640 [Eciton burchellii]|nr:hypothetical protein HN011_006640 [Eciton burchellii]
MMHAITRKYKVASYPSSQMAATTVTAFPNSHPKSDDATLRSGIFRKGTHPSSKIRNSNVQNEYGITEASRTARPSFRESSDLVLSLTSIYFLIHINVSTRVSQDN